MVFSDFKVIEEFERTVEVKRDMESGQVIGWDHFFEYIKEQDFLKGEELAEAQVVRQAIDKKAAQQQATYSVSQKEDGTIHVKELADSDAPSIEVKAVQDSEGTRPRIEGLPVELSVFLFNFTDAEIMTSTLDVIRVLITMHDSRQDGKLDI